MTNEPLFPVVDLRSATGLSVVFLPLDQGSEQEQQVISEATDILSRHGSEMWGTEAGDDEMTVEEIIELGADAAEVWYFKVLTLLKAHKLEAAETLCALNTVITETGAALFCQFLPDLEVDPDQIVVSESEFE